jgi:hypothetical protein
LGIAYEEDETISRPIRLSPRSQTNHGRVNVQSIQPRGLKGPENCSSTCTVATADLQTAGPRIHVSQPL